MAHALRRVSYATCVSEHKQFALLAREPNGEANVQYCHLFVTDTHKQVCIRFSIILNRCIGKYILQHASMTQLILLSLIELLLVHRFSASSFVGLS